MGKSGDVQAVDDVSGRHGDADERRRRNERLPARKRVGDGEHGVGRPRHVQSPLGAQPVDHRRPDEQAAYDERGVQYADTGRSKTLLGVDRALQSLEAAVADVDEEINAAEVDQGEVDIASKRHAGQRLVNARCLRHCLQLNDKTTTSSASVAYLEI